MKAGTRRKNEILRDGDRNKKIPGREKVKSKR